MRSVLHTSVAEEEVLALMADPAAEPADDFVEDTVTRLLELVALPVPAGLPRST